jgi:hypothetical protein
MIGLISCLATGAAVLALIGVAIWVIAGEAWGLAYTAVVAMLLAATLFLLIF